MAESNEELLRKIYDLERDNNRMLRSMRRSSFFAGVFRVALWVGLALVSWWVYQEYFAPIIASMLETMQQIQGTSAQAQAQFGALQDAMSRLKELGF